MQETYSNCLGRAVCGENEHRKAGKLLFDVFNALISIIIYMYQLGSVYIYIYYIYNVLYNFFFDPGLLGSYL